MNMLREIRRLGPEQEFTDFSQGFIGAYPASKSTPEQLSQRLMASARDPKNHYMGVFEDGKMVGGFILYDFRVNCLGQFIDAGGVGAIWVDFLQKKRGIAKEIVTFFLDHYDQAGAPLTLLYPFRPDFYHQMGFGFGPRQDHYVFTPLSLPGDRMPHGLSFLTAEDEDMILACRKEYAAVHHGEPMMHYGEFVGMTLGVMARRQIVGLKENGVLRGYMTFSWKNHDNNFVKNDLVIHDWICDGPATRQRFCNFLRSQADQVHRIWYDTQDPAFHYLLSDVGNGTDNLIPSVYHETATSGVGLMYRVTVRDFLAATAHRNYGGVTADVILRVRDSFRPANAGEYRLSFRDGRLTATEGPVAASAAAGGGATPADAVMLSLDVAELSALLMGATDVASLHRNLRAEADAAHIPLLTKLFACERPTFIRAF